MPRFFLRKAARIRGEKPRVRHISTEASARKWADIEPYLQRDWEARNPGTPWQRFKDAIRTGFEQLRR